MYKHKKAFVYLATISLSYSMFGQTNTEEYETGFYKNRIYFSAGIGAGNLAQKSIEIASDASQDYVQLNFNKKPNLYFKGEYAVSNRFGVGLHVATSGMDLSYRIPDSFFSANVNKYIPAEVAVKYNTWSVNVRANYHFIKGKQIDVYTGISIGFRNNTLRIEDNDPNKKWELPLKLFNIRIPSVSFPSVGGDLTTGIRYTPIKNIGIFAEIGIAKTIVQGGVVFGF